eukprot:200210_1
MAELKSDDKKQSNESILSLPGDEPTLNPNVFSTMANADIHRDTDDHYNETVNKQAELILSSNKSKIIEVMERNKNEITVKLFVEYDEYIKIRSVNKGKGLKVSEIRSDTEYGIEFEKTGIEKEWILTKIGNDKADKLLFNIAKNQLHALVKVAKKGGYKVTFRAKKDIV